MNDELLFGFHVRSLDELNKVLDAGSNVIELKPYNLQQSGFPIYEYDGVHFHINHKNAKIISKLAKKHRAQVQIHIPYERFADPREEAGLCQILERHRETIFERFKLIEKLRFKYGLGQVVTMHPGLFKFQNSLILFEDEALEKNQIFFSELDQYLRKNCHFKLAVENVTAPKDIYASLGYTTEQLLYLLQNTSNIGLTIDTGHRNLVSKLSVRDLVGKFDVYNIHLHMNEGKPDPHSFDDDEHRFAGIYNLPHFHNYARMIKDRRIPVICEVGTYHKSVSKLKEYREQTMQDILEN